MIERALFLRNPIGHLTYESNDLSDLNKAEWDALMIIQDILAIPSKFQQLLSGQRMPILADYIPAFQGVLDELKELLEDPQFIPAYDAIQAGIQKAEDYASHAHFTKVPACTLATCQYFSTLLSIHIMILTNG
ncbi:hypothetical protein DL93DRAFT_2184051 [Clavulina sp. PMI_390]|nr:hypothetical protein DL93DRAFT_2184051 [Clavulina sp. PMI_390]